MKRKFSSFNINDLSTWGLPICLLAGCLIIAAVTYAGQSFFVGGITQNIEKKADKIAKTEREYMKNMRTLAVLPQIRQEVKELEKVRDEAKKFLPTEVSMPNLIDSVYESARNNGIIFGSFAPQADIDTPYYTIKPISLSTNTGYLSMAAFIEEVTTLKRIMNVDSVSFSSSQSTPEPDENLPLNVTAQLRTYIFKE